MGTTEEVGPARNDEAKPAMLVVGATGSLGGAITRTLLENGESVRITVRDGSSYGDLVNMGAEAVHADLKDPASLRAACESVDAVITTANAIGRGGDDTIESVDLEGNQNLIAAAAEAGVKRFVFTSAIGASAEHPVPFLQAKGQTEERLKESGMDWTILQPNLFMDVWIPTVVGGAALAGRPVTIVGEGKKQHSMVAMRDVVAYAVAALGNDAARNRTLVIGGPQPLCWWDIITAFKEALGRDVAVETLPLGTPVPGFPDAVNGLLQGLEFYESPIDMDELSSTFGVRPTPLTEYLSGFVEPS